MICAERECYGVEKINLTNTINNGTKEENGVNEDN